jgi:hypothetical protein
MQERPPLLLDECYKDLMTGAHFVYSSAILKQELFIRIPV